MTTYVIGLLLMLGGLGTIIFKMMAGANAQDLLKNQETKGKVIDLEKFIAKDQGLLEAEKAKRDQAEADLKAKENADVTQKDLVDFLNGKPTDNK